MPVKVITGTPICRDSSYIIDKFLANQRSIQQSYPTSELILSTSDDFFASELEQLVKDAQVKATVLRHHVAMPDYARSKIWDIVSGREAIRRYVQVQTRADYLLFLDADMIFDPLIIEILLKEIIGFDVIFSGYPMRRHGIGLAGAGCVMLTRNILERLRFRCYEFKNGEVIFEDNMLEYDLYRLGGRVKKGFFVATSHYLNATDFRHIEPQGVSLSRRISNTSFIRYFLIKASIATRHNIPWKLKVLLGKLR